MRLIKRYKKKYDSQSFRKYLSLLLGQNKSLLHILHHVTVQGLSTVCCLNVLYLV